MAYKLIYSTEFEKDFEEFTLYTLDYSEAYFEKILTSFNTSIIRYIADNPYLWGQAPMVIGDYRAYLFDAGKKTKFWIVYQIDESKQEIYLLQFWNVAKNPSNFEI